MLVEGLYSELSKSTADASVDVQIKIDNNHQIFKGHFPDNPVMPGVCLLQIMKEFTEDFAELSPKAYVEHILVKELNTKKVVIGYDHHFGKNRSANIKDLRAFAKTYDFEVEEISAQDIKDVTVSSTKIRNALDNGKIHIVAPGCSLY